MYCNSCQTQIPKDEIVYCSQCGVPLHKGCANHCLDCGKVLCDTCSLDNNFKCETCYKPEDIFPVIRRSHLEAYAGCPYSVYLQLVSGIEPPMGGAAQMGVLVHQLIEEGISIEAMHEDIDILIKEWNTQTDDDYSLITPELNENAHKCIDNYSKIKDYFLDCDARTEYNIQFTLDDDLPKVSCTLDKILEKDGRLEVHDWKTGRPMSGKKLVSDLQPPLYMYAVYTIYGKMPDSFTLHYLREDKHITYNKIDENTYEVKTKRNTYTLDIQDALNRTREILKGIKDNKFNMPNEKAQFRCKTLCWFGLSGKCQGSFQEQWRNLNDLQRD